MKANFEDSLQHVLKHEGGYVNHPDDPGGMTNLGCTKVVWEDWIGRPVTEAEMRALKPSDVAPLYKARYWDKVRGDDLPAGVDYAVFDYAINSGVNRAARALQAAVGVNVDGQIGPKTIAAVAALPAAEVVTRLNDSRMAFLKALPKWSVFGRGWGRRVEEVTVASSGMVQDGTSNLS